MGYDRTGCQACRSREYPQIGLTSTSFFPALRRRNGPDWWSAIPGTGSNGIGKTLSASCRWTGSRAEATSMAFGSDRAVDVKVHGDWSENMGSGASVGAGNYPAKYSFSTSTANCASAASPDFVVFSTGLQSSGTVASIVAYDNLYSGCAGPVPQTYFAYNTTATAAGTIKTSPVFSLDGSQLAFVQTDGLHGTVILLKWAANTGTIASPATPSLVTLG